MRVYVVMKERQSPIAFTVPKMHLAFKTRKQANAEADRLNKRAMTHDYWVESLKVECE